MAAKKRKRKDKSGYVIGQTAADFANVLAHRIKTAQVKTATPSRAQNRIQVRIAWKEPNGNPGLGYYSMHIQTAESLAKKHSGGPSLFNFIDDVFRIISWAKAATHDKHGSISWDYGEIHQSVRDELTACGALNGTAKIHTLYGECMQAIAACFRAGKHNTARTAKNREKAKEAIGRVIAFALANGMNDKEIREYIDVAFVQHTMDS